jgi:hypothetical protein
MQVVVQKTIFCRWKQWVTSVFRYKECVLFIDFMEKGTIIQTLTVNSLDLAPIHPQRKDYVDSNKKMPIMCLRMFETESEL